MIVFSKFCGSFLVTLLRLSISKFTKSSSKSSSICYGIVFNFDGFRTDLDRVVLTHVLYGRDTWLLLDFWWS